MTDTISLGIDPETKEEIRLEPFHTLVAGQTNLSGKTTTVKKLLPQLVELGYTVLVFDSKPTEREFKGYTDIPLVYRPTTDPLVLMGLLEGIFKHRMGNYYSTLSRMTEDAIDLPDIIENAKKMEQKSKSGFIKDACHTLADLLKRLLKELEGLKLSEELELAPATINVMPVNDLSIEAQQLVVSKAFELMLKKHNRKVVAVIDEAWRFLPEGYSSACLPPDQLVVTESGLKPIREVSMGDMVLTHRGRLRKVTRLHQRTYTGKVVEFCATGSGNAVDLHTILTPEHPILSACASHSGNSYFLKQEQWMQAEQLSQKMVHPWQTRLVYPVPNENADTVSITLKVIWHTKPRRVAFKIDDDMLVVLGYYLAEGFATGRNIGLSFGKNLREYMLAADATARLARLGYSPHLSLKRFGWRVEFSSKTLTALLSQFGFGAKNKRLPQWVKNLPIERLWPLVEAYLKGDGYKTKRGGFALSTVSRQLATDITHIAPKLHLWASISTIDHPERNLGWHVIKPSHQYRVCLSPLESRTNTLRMDERFTYRPFSTKMHQYTGDVYNLEVEEDNSYCTPFLTVHNCKHAIQDVITQGAKTNLFVWLTTQFLAPTEKDPLKAMPNKLLGRQDHNTEIEATQRLIPGGRGKFSSDAIMTLKRGEFIFVPLEGITHKVYITLSEEYKTLLQVQKTEEEKTQNDDWTELYDDAHELRKKIEAIEV